MIPLNLNLPPSTLLMGDPSSEQGRDFADFGTIRDVRVRCAEGEWEVVLGVLPIVADCMRELWGALEGADGSGAERVQTPVIGLIPLAGGLEASCWVRAARLLSVEGGGEPEGSHDLVRIHCLYAKQAPLARWPQVLPRGPYIRVPMAVGKGGLIDWMIHRLDKYVPPFFQGNPRKSGLVLHLPEHVGV